MARHRAGTACGPALACLAGAAFLLVACGGETQKHTASAADTTAQLPAPPKSDASPTASNVAISPDILQACHIATADAYFSFDASTVTQSDRSPLDAVAACFSNGPLSGHRMKLVGRADPRGESDYNVTLGQARADAVAGYLDRHGLTAAQTATTSRGAMDATGTSETGWAKDRRVDVLLAD
ncbi:MAG: OmpA family protein [Polyangiaceae bacterium]